MLLLDERVYVPLKLFEEHLPVFLSIYEIEFSPEQHEVIRAQLPDDLKSILTGRIHAIKSPLQIIDDQQQYLIDNPVVMDTILCYVNQEDIASPAFIRIARIRSSVLLKYLDQKYPKVCQSTKEHFLQNVPIGVPLSRQIAGFKYFCILRQVHRAIFESLLLELTIKICLQA